MLDTALNHPESNVLYVTLNRLSAKRIIWRDLMKVNKQYRLGGKPDNTELTLSFPNGSVIYISGAKDKTEIEKFRGMSLKLVYIDEAQSFRDYIRELINDVIIPATYDTAGRVAMIGTPAPLLMGAFYEACHDTGEFQGWSHHHWTMLDNPWIKKKSGREPADIIAGELKRKGLGDDDPTHLRENLGQWVEDRDILIYKFRTAYNLYKGELPEGHRWKYVLGIDTGYGDSDAIAVLAYSHTCPNVYLVEEYLEPNQGWDALAAKIKELDDKYMPVKKVIDYASGAKKFTEDLLERDGILVENAEKHRKMEFIDFLNNDLLAGRIKLYEGSQLEQDWRLVQKDKDKSTNAKTVISDSFHSDIADAFLYAWRECYHFIQEEVKEKPDPNSQEYQDKIEREEIERLEQEMQEEQWDSALDRSYNQF